MRTFLIILVALSCTVATAQTSDEIREKIEGMNWMTEQYPPFNYIDKANGELKGITVDILFEMFKKLGVRVKKADLRVLPWQESYKLLQEKPRTALFSTTYTEERL
jgi:polar amino acid transport system substrate-binding protein